MSKHRRVVGPPCTSCKQPAGGVHLCSGCTRDVQRTLSDIPALAHDLELTRARQDRMRGDAVGSPANPSSGPLWNERASRAARALHAVLAHEAGTLATVLQEPAPVGSTASLAGWLLARVPEIRTRDTAGDTVARLAAVVRRGCGAIDRPADAVYGGRCECDDADLYAQGPATHFTCPSCGTVYDFETRRDWLLGATADSLLSASEASRALAGMLGRPLSPNTIRTWVHNGRLVAHGRDGDRPLYRVGDLVELARSTATRQRRPAVA